MSQNKARLCFWTKIVFPDSSSTLQISEAGSGSADRPSLPGYQMSGPARPGLHPPRLLAAEGETRSLVSAGLASTAESGAQRALPGSAARAGHTVQTICA